MGKLISWKVARANGKPLAACVALSSVRSWHHLTWWRCCYSCRSLVWQHHLFTTPQYTDIHSRFPSIAELAISCGIPSALVPNLGIFFRQVNTFHIHTETAILSFSICSLLSSTCFRYHTSFDQIIIILRSTCPNHSDLCFNSIKTVQTTKQRQVVDNNNNNNNNINTFIVIHYTGRIVPRYVHIK